MASWKEKILSDVADVIPGFAFKSVDFGDVGVPVVKIKDITPPRVAVEGCEKVNLSAYDTTKIEKYRLRKGDFLVAMTGATIGKVGRIKDEFDGYLNQRVAKIKAKHGLADNNFIYYAIFPKRFQEFVVNAASGSSVQENASGNDIGDYDLLIPPSITEQTTIASVLSSLDAKIDLLHSQNKTLEQLAETLFRQWFVGEVKEEWEEKPLDEIADYLNGLALQKYPAKIDDYLPVIKIKELNQGITESSDKCSRTIPSQYIIQNGDVLFSWSGSLVVKIWDDGEGALNQHLFKVTSGQYPKWFYYLATRYHLENFRIIAESKSTTMGHIQREHLAEAKISIPPKALFDAYDNAIAPLIEKEIKNNGQIRQLTHLRDMLLPKLMSGEVRVKI
jgi:type I restriction enzyme S subunit